MTDDRQWHFLDGRTLPIGTMYCIGRNYAAHAAEMGALVPTTPIVFLKPPASYVPSGSVVTLPSWTQNVHHEVELVVVIGENGTVAGYGIGLDLTARDVQQAAKEHGEPWATAKGWRGAAPVSEIIPAHAAGDGPWTLDLTVNGEPRQHASTALMERSIASLVQHIADIFTLRSGDCIFTGTPEGVAAVRRGDHAVARLDDLVTLTIDFV